MHDGCRPRRNARSARDRYERIKARSGSPDHDLPPDRQRASLDKVHVATRRVALFTRCHAGRVGRRWSDAELAHLWDYRDRPAREHALELGRTLYGVKAKRSDLHRRHRDVE